MGYGEEGLIAEPLLFHISFVDMLLKRLLVCSGWSIFRCLYSSFSISYVPMSTSARVADMARSNPTIGTFHFAFQ